MKKIFIFFVMMYFTFSITAQPNFSFDYLDVNNISARINSDGILFSDEISEIARFIVPKNAGTTSIFTSSLWFGGVHSVTGELHVAANKFRKEGVDFTQGQIGSSPSDNALWKVNRSSILHHMAHYQDVNYFMAAEIANWGGPFEDINDNQIYEPLLGEYPKIIGDQAIFFIYNDVIEHTSSGGLPLGIEIQATAYAFTGEGMSVTDSANLTNTIFIRYNIINKSENNYVDFYIGSFTDPDLGYAHDDYVGFDTTLRMFYAYNGKEIDGTGQPYAYGDLLPAQGIMLLNRDVYSFMCFSNGNIPTGDPRVAAEYYNYMQSIWRDNTALRDPTGNFCKIMLTGDPVTGTGWIESTQMGAPGDRRGLISTYIGDFNAGENICIDIAYPFAQSETPSGALVPITLLRERATAIRNFYTQNQYSCDIFTVGITTNKKEDVKEVALYPNPTKGELRIDNGELRMENVAVYDLLGRIQKSKIVNLQSEIVIDISHLPAGLYFVQLSTEKGAITKKVVKQ